MAIAAQDYAVLASQFEAGINLQVSHREALYAFNGKIDCLGKRIRNNATTFRNGDQF